MKVEMKDQLSWNFIFDPRPFVTHFLTETACGRQTTTQITPTPKAVPCGQQAVGSQSVKSSTFGWHAEEPGL